MRKILFLVFCLSLASLSAGSLRLVNNSPYKLRALIRGGDGTYLGEMVILPEHTNVWSNEFPSFGPGGQSYSENPPRSLTPYTVYWSCLDGGEYGVSFNVASGAAVTAQASQGRRYCSTEARDRNRSPYGPKAGDEQLQNNQADAPNPQSSQ